MMYDAPYPQGGPWGNLCETCWKAGGNTQLGIGLGQKYTLQYNTPSAMLIDQLGEGAYDQEWVQVEGGSLTGLADIHGDQYPEDMCPMGDFHGDMPDGDLCPFCGAVCSG